MIGLFSVPADEPACLMTIVRSRIVIVVDRGEPVLFVAKRNDTRSSPQRGIQLSTVTQDAEETALHWQPSWSGPPHEVSVELDTTSNEKSPPAAGTSKLSRLTP